MQQLKDLGEKEIIRSILKPLFNPSNDPHGVGDDCAVLPVTPERSICISTDRVPADLLSYKHNIINIAQLGYYLAILNISDIAATGATPSGMLLTLAFPDDFPLASLTKLLYGIHHGALEYNCPVLGGDLSNSQEISLSATVIGTAVTDHILYRSTAQPGDPIFCSDYIGLTPTAFKYFLQLKPTGFSLPLDEEELLANQFRHPRARVALGQFLSANTITSSCMDNTDGFTQTFSELSEMNSLQFFFEYNLLPIHPVSFKIAAALNLDIIDLIFSAGADFQLLGTLKFSMVPNLISALNNHNIMLIGTTKPGTGLHLVTATGTARPITPSGWNYYQTF